MRDRLTNASLRARFGVEERNKAAVSRYIREAVEDGKIKPFDEEVPIDTEILLANIPALGAWHERLAVEIVKLAEKRHQELIK